MQHSASSLLQRQLKLAQCTGGRHQGQLLAALVLLLVPEVDTLWLQPMRRRRNQSPHRWRCCTAAPCRPLPLSLPLPLPVAAACVSAAVLVPPDPSPCCHAMLPLSAAAAWVRVAVARPDEVSLLQAAHLALPTPCPRRHQWGPAPPSLKLSEPSQRRACGRQACHSRQRLQRLAGRVCPALGQS